MLARFLILTIVCLLFSPYCLSQNSTNKESRIIGGSATTVRKIRYILNLHLNGQVICGATLIKSRWVITAAHCVKGTSAKSLTVVGGQTKLNGNGVRRNVVKVIIPQAYNSRNYHMDIAVLKLASPMKGQNIRAIKMCNQPLKAGQRMRVSGWGLTNENGKAPSNQVRTVLVPVIGRQSCEKSYQNAARLTNSMFCAGVRGRKDSCQGDSGGPGVVKGRLCGVVSWGIGCADKRFPGVYTSINNVMGFIKKAMKK